MELESKALETTRDTTGARPVDRASVCAMLLCVTLCSFLGCRSDSVSDRVFRYRAALESVLDAPSNEQLPRVRLRLPPRRDRRLDVSDHRIGFFDFLSTVGCPLSEVLAARNSALGKVLVPTRRLAHEVNVLSAIDDCLPTLPEARATRLREQATYKRTDLPSHVWNAVWLDENLERFLSTAPAAFIGRGDPSDGAKQLAHAAEALERLDVEALDSALHALRDDPSMGARLTDLVIATEELHRVVRLLAEHNAKSQGDACNDQSRRLSRVFESQYVAFQPELAALDRTGHELISSLRSLFLATASETVAIPEAMQRFRRDLLGDADGADLSARFRDVIVQHATAWGPVLVECGVIPGRPA